MPPPTAYDRGEKFAYYRQIASLQDYVLLSQDRVQVEPFTRNGEFWLYRSLDSLEDTLLLTSIDCHIPMVEIYDKVTFEPEERSQSALPDAD